MKNIVIVESPAKTKTIEKYLGSNYKVLSSKGHIRDLATTGKYGLGVDVDDNFKPNYINIRGKGKVITDLKKQIKDADKVILATDPDREGEAISWHLFDALKLKEDKYDRVVFNEITKSILLDAFAHPRKIDMNLVNSQETRRILDRIIGFRLSKLMQSKTGGKSAGRVQSVALKLIVDREREIDAFIPDEYWTIKADFKDYQADLEKYQNKKIEIKSKVEADEIMSKLSNSFNIESVDQEDKKKNQIMPLETSTLQQMAVNRLGFSSSKTMKVAQKLYEGIDLEHETTGLITYMRTDAIRLSDSFVSDAFSFIKKNYGDEYVGHAKQGKSKQNVQDAHESIRPTDIQKTPESIKKYLSNDEYKLYKMIYIRTLASLMAEAKYKVTTVWLENNNYQFKITGNILNFDGYLKVYSEYSQNEDVILPDFNSYKTKVLVASKIIPEQHFTKPKPRYTEASLIKELKKSGIGRPATYAKIIDTLKIRNYVNVLEKKFYPTEVGITTTDKLQEYFSNLINVKYTAEMEEDLDKIAEANAKELKILTDFYKQFDSMVEEAYKGMEKKEPEKTGEVCPQCGSDLVRRNGRYGEFTACSNFPKCKYIKKEEQKVVEVMDCPKCDGKIVEKRTRRGKIFYGCSKYPDCDFAAWDKPIEEKCPNCQGTLVEKGKKQKCINCDYVSE